MGRTRKRSKAVRTQEALVTDSRGRPDARRKLARYLNNLALLLATTGRSREAEDHYRESVAILEAFVASDSQDGMRVSLLCKKCGDHRSFWKF